jgi:hypothetical protein
MDISGKWTYKEDFDYGKSIGEVDFVQAKNEVIGLFTFTESVEELYTIEVSEKVKGTIKDGKLLLNSIEVKALEDSAVVEYSSNNYEIYLSSENKLAGSTYDDDEVCGVFVMERIQQ